MILKQFSVQIETTVSPNVFIPQQGSLPDERMSL